MIVAHKQDLKTKLHQLIFVNSPAPNAILIQRGNNKNFT